MTGVKLTGAVLLMAVLSLMPSSPVSALSCMEPTAENGKAEFAGYETIAAAEVVTGTKTPFLNRLSTMHVRPVEIYKGTIDRPDIKVAYNADPAQFGYVREKGSRVLIVREAGSAEFTLTGPCSSLAAYLKAAGLQ